MANDYQKEMAADVRRVDQVANEAAQEATPENMPVKQEWVSDPLPGDSGAYKHLEPTFGMLP